ncbi:hypothetical protein BVX97_01805 [bacterium E08(2017)]|nr:hypothetical protein BVX97_01805 [bacterium E08(2017)]
MMRRLFILSVISAVIFLQSADAQNYFTNAVDDLLGTPGNWTAGLPTNSINVGIIREGDSVTNSTGVTYTNYYLEFQTNSSLRNLKYAQSGAAMSGGELTLNGGTISVDRGLTTRGGAIWTINSGTFNGELSLWDSGTTVHINGGSITGTKSIVVRAGTVLNINGGEVGSASTYLSQLGGNTVFSGDGGVANFNGGDCYFNSVIGCFSAAAIMRYNVIGQTGSINANNISQNQNSETTIRINFQPGTGIPFTIANSNGWAEVEWNADRLLYNGSNSTEWGGLTWAGATNWNAFGRYYRFNFESNTLSLAYEPPPSGTAIIVQ